MTSLLAPSRAGDPAAVPTRTETADAPFAPKHVLLLLGVFFLSLYVLTMSGHFSSPDEEIMYQVTRSMAELRGFGIGAGSGGSTFLTVPGSDGALYGPYGVVPSTLGVPAYLVGRAVAATLPPRYSEVVPRFFFAMDDAVVSALTCAGGVPLRVQARIRKSRGGARQPGVRPGHPCLAVFQVRLERAGDGVVPGAGRVGRVRGRTSLELAMGAGQRADARAGDRVEDHDGRSWCR